MVKKNKKIKKIKRYRPTNPFLTGEDIDMLKEKKERPIIIPKTCDTHEDGA